MNAGYISAFAALAGSLIGGLTTFAAAWVTQRQQANVQWLLQEKTRRQELYQQRLIIRPLLAEELYFRFSQGRDVQ